MAPNHKWAFKARFRRHAFGWRSQPAVTRVREAVTEIKKVAKKEPVLAAEGAVVLLERLSPALEHVDSSSGAIGSAVNGAIDELAAIIAKAPAEDPTRDAWLERLFEAHAADQIPYIEALTEHWGALCVTKERASAWADRLLGITRVAFSPDKALRGHFHGAEACLSALFFAERYEELIDLVQHERYWPYKAYAVRALAAQGKKAEALRYAESCRSPWTNDASVDAVCEALLLSSGLHEEAYARYGVRQSMGGTFLSTFRSVAKRYPHKPQAEILADLVKTTPGAEGKWFAAAKAAGLYDEALALAERSACDPKTLARAARDYAQKRSDFAVRAGLLSLHWMMQGYGYELTGADVMDAYRATLEAAAHQGRVAEVEALIRKMAATGDVDGFVSKVLGRALGW